MFRTIFDGKDVKLVQIYMLAVSLLLKAFPGERSGNKESHSMMFRDEDCERGSLGMEN